MNTNDTGGVSFVFHGNVFNRPLAKLCMSEFVSRVRNCWISLSLSLSLSFFLSLYIYIFLSLCEHAAILPSLQAMLNNRLEYVWYFSEHQLLSPWHAKTYYVYSIILIFVTKDKQKSLVRGFNSFFNFSCKLQRI